MKDDIKDAFAALVLATLEKKDFEFKTYLQTGRNDGFRTTVKIAGTNVTITIEKKKRTENHSEVEPDPRMFGDTKAVTDRAMENWYPGKTNTWSETTTTVKIGARGLPDIDAHEETYRYTEWTYRDDTKKAVENIIELIERRYREIEHETEKKNRVKEADRLKNAFAKI